MLKLTNTKIIISGSTIEAYSYQDSPLSYGHTVINRSKSRERNTGTDTKSIERKAESNKRSTRRAGLELRKLVNSNTGRYIATSGVICDPIFATFTFSDDIRDINVANDIFLKFIHRLNYKVSGGSKKSCLKYVSVIGFQDANREGVIHYHTIFFNISPKQEVFISETWNAGIVDIQKVEDSENVGLYMSKHITYNSGDVRLNGHKRYFGSKGLFKAIEIKDQSKARSIISLIPSDYVPRKDTFIGFQGEVICSKYVLNKGETLLDLVPEIKLFL